MAVTHKGGSMEIEPLGIRAVVPAKAVSFGRTQLVKISVIPRIADYVPMTENEVFAASGIECIPDGLELMAPMTIVMPHSIPLSTCQDIVPILYSGVKQIGETGRDNPFGSPTCRIQTRKFVLYHATSIFRNIMPFELKHERTHNNIARLIY